ncbi:MAG: TolC family protein, partial [Phycisphaerales bacterium]
HIISNTHSSMPVPGAGSQGYQVSATLNKLLYDYNHTRSLVQQAAAEERSANADLTRTQADLVFQVKQAFYTYLQDVRLVAVSESNVHNQEGHLRAAQARLNTGIGLPYDVVRAQTAYTAAIFDLNLARNSASVSRVQLAEMIGVDPRTPIIAAEASEPAVIPTDVESLTQEALRLRPEMAQVQAGIEAATTCSRPCRTGATAWSGTTTRTCGMPG